MKQFYKLKEFSAKGNIFVSFALCIVLMFIYSYFKHMAFACIHVIHVHGFLKKPESPRTGVTEGC